MVRWIAAAAALSLFPSLSCAQASQQAATSGAVLLVGNKGEDTLSFIDLASGKEIGRSATGKWPHEVAISPDGTKRRSSLMAARRSTSSRSRRERS